MTLSPHVENLQVEFGVDADGNGQIDPGEFPIHDLAGSDPSQVLTVRLSVIARTLRQDPNVAGSGMSVAANHVGSAPDGFFRRRFTASAAPRNLR